jgi:hypothetical protein
VHIAAASSLTPIEFFAARQQELKANRAQVVLCDGDTLRGPRGRRNSHSDRRSRWNSHSDRSGRRSSHSDRTSRWNSHSDRSGRRSWRDGVRQFNLAMKNKVNLMVCQ